MEDLSNNCTIIDYLMEKRKFLLPSCGPLPLQITRRNGSILQFYWDLLHLPLPIWVWCQKGNSNYLLSEFQGVPGVDGMCNLLSVPSVCLRVCWVGGSSPGRHLGGSHDAWTTSTRSSSSLSSTLMFDSGLSENELTHLGETLLSWCRLWSFPFRHFP